MSRKRQSSQRSPSPEEDSQETNLHFVSAGFKYQGPQTVPIHLCPLFLVVGMDIQDGERDDVKGASFWKKNNKAVPGRPSPRKEDKVVSSYIPSSSTSFQDFQQSINDAWDLGDDEFCNISNMKVNRRPSQMTGDNVINIHKHLNRGEIMKNCSLHNSCKGGSYPSWMACGDTLKKEGVGRPVSKFPDSSGDILKNKAVEIKNNSGRNGSGNDAYRNRVKKFQTLLNAPQINLSDLKNLSWPGIPFPLKAETWRILAGYASTRSDIREENLMKKRAEYWFYVREHYETDARDNTYQGTYRQIHIDIPRMSPNILLFRQKAVQTMFERILFIWSVKNPASGYVQGINDLVTPFFIVFLHNVLESDLDLDTVNVELIPQEKRDIVEADSFWCFCTFLGGIQDNYIFPQLGIQSKINDLRDIINRIDGPLHKHLQDNGVEYLQFSFRWMNNLLTRELPLRCLIRLWDTYLAELDSFASFQLYVCAAFLLHWKQDLMLQKDFQGLMLTLQNLPTQNWNDSDIDLLVAEAHRLKSTYEGARNHFQSKNS